MRKSVSHQSRKKAIKMEDQSHEKQPQHEEVECKMCDVKGDSPKIKTATSQSREKKQKSSAGSKIMQNNHQESEPEELDECLLEVLPGQRIA